VIRGPRSPNCSIPMTGSVPIRSKPTIAVGMYSQTGRSRGRLREHRAVRGPATPGAWTTDFSDRVLGDCACDITDAEREVCGFTT
jgi:hypothetical protein